MDVGQGARILRDAGLVQASLGNEFLGLPGTVASGVSGTYIAWYKLETGEIRTVFQFLGEAGSGWIPIPGASTLLSVRQSNSTSNYQAVFSTSLQISDVY